MDSHPFFRSKFRVMMIIGLIILVTILQGWLLMVYCRTETVSAMIDSLVSIILLGLLGYLLWYVVGFLRAFQAEILLSLLVISIWIAGTYVSSFLGNDMVGVSRDIFLRTIPLRLVIGISCWTVLFLWYRILRLQAWKEERVVAENLQRIQTDDLADRIAVKDGSRIHIIRLDDLLYVQASGDYVTLFTSSGQYLKEQTMKFLEAHLPAVRFVRIHRSYLVNVEQIQRVELYGKETYHVLLKNGVQLRASSTGYKLLKEKLAL